MVRLSLWLFLLAGLAAFAGGPSAPAHARSKPKPVVTTVYLVRHAEKDSMDNPLDPTLSAAGIARTLVLRRLLAGNHLSALFTTDTKRTRATFIPLASAVGLEPQVYDAQQLETLALRIQQEYVGKAVAVVGHANTLLPLIKALGATPPIQEIGSDKYDYFFTVRLSEGKPTTVSVGSYGARRRAAKAKVSAAR